MGERIFQSQYPIMLAAMNKVSTVNFAIAASKAGIFPSISAYNYYGKKMLFDIDQLEKDLIHFNESIGNNNLILSIELLDLVNSQVLKLVEKNLFSHIEIIDETQHLYYSETSDSPVVFEKNLSKLENIFQMIESYNIRSFFKILIPDHWTQKYDRTKKLFAGAILKSADGAGKTIIDKNRLPLLLEFKQLHKSYPDKIFIPTGGIHSRMQVKSFLEEGAKMIGIGSYLICSEECEIAKEVKLKIIESTLRDIKRFKTGQNALIFSNVSNDDMNHSISLEQGIKKADTGHVYMGSALEHIRNIRPIKDIIEELVDGLV